MNNLDKLGAFGLFLLGCSMMLAAGLLAEWFNDWYDR
jgi:hypothetical protein